VAKDKVGNVKQINSLVYNKQNIQHIQANNPHNS